LLFFGVQNVRESRVRAIVEIPKPPETVNPTPWILLTSI